MANDGVPAEKAAGFDPESRFVRNPGVLWRQVAGVILLRTVDGPQTVELFGTGVLLWLALAEPITAGELAAELAAVIGVPVEIVTPDVQAALADLAARGLVTQLGAFR